MLLLPHCKINLGLHVLAKRPDGYHDLETVFYPVPLRDNLEITPLRGEDAPYRLETGGLSVEGSAADNLVVKVYLSLREEFRLPPVRIYLHKLIPTGAGLGGGSSDAAFMMRGLNELFGLGLSQADMRQRVARFGADCAFFVQDRAAYATGIGDRLSPLPLSLKGLHIALVKPHVSVSTKEAYAHVTPKPAAYPLREAVTRPVEEWRNLIANDFEASVFPHHPELTAIKQTLYDMGALYAAMSGSGSTVFGIFSRPVPEAENIFADCFVFTRKFAL